MDSPPLRPPASPARAEAYRVAILDDHPLVRRGVAGILSDQPDLHWAGEAACEREALHLLQNERVDLLVVDWSLGTRDSAFLIETFLLRYPGLRVLVLSVHDETTHAEAAVRAGARGYIMKEEASEKILAGVRVVLSGSYFFSERAMASLSAAAMKRISGFEVVRGGRSSAATEFAREPFSQWAVSVVVPVFNSAATLVPLCERLLSTLEKVHSLEIILVDDGSRDDSAWVCKALNARYPETIQYLCLSRNFGEQSALLVGLREARGDYCVLMDDDLQNPPEEVPAMLREAALGYDVVYSQYTQRCHPLHRRLGSAFHNWVANFALRKPRDLYLSSFKVLSARLVSAVGAYRGPDPFLDALILRATANIGRVRCRHEPRERGRSGYSLFKLVALWWALIAGFSSWPLRAAACLTPLGALLLLTSIEYSVPARAWALKVLGTFAFGGGLWLLGEQLGLLRERQIGISELVIRDRSAPSVSSSSECVDPVSQTRPVVQ